MTTEEHLNLIKARCLELLAIAEKRTPGKWYESGGRDSIIGNNEFGFAAKEDIVTRPKRDNFWKYNCSFIASCAGPAEAGWKATVAAIDLLFYDDHECEIEGCFGCQTIKTILSAWPLEILTKETT